MGQACCNSDGSGEVVPAAEAVTGGEKANGLTHGRTTSRETSRGMVPIEPTKNVADKAPEATAEPAGANVAEPAVTVLEPIKENPPPDLAAPAAVAMTQKEVEAPPQDEAPAPAAKATLELTMDDKGTERVFKFEELAAGEKLGITFETGKVPIVVQSFPAGSKAEARGMKTGMMLKKIDGVDVAGKKYSTIMDMVREGVLAITPAKK